jgi:hypothetical protein
MMGSSTLPLILRTSDDLFAHFVSASKSATRDDWRKVNRSAGSLERTRSNPRASVRVIARGPID